MSEHKHKFYFFPEIRGAKCDCGNVRFDTILFGMAESNHEKTWLVSSKRILWEQS